MVTRTTTRAPHLPIPDRACSFCGKVFRPHSNAAPGLYCSYKCLHSANQKFDRKEAVRIYVEERCSTAETARRLGVSTSTISRALVRQGVKIRPRYSHIYSRDDTSRRCSKCREWKTFDQFSPSTHARMSAWCKSCMGLKVADWHEENRPRTRATARLRTYGLSEADYREMERQQNFVCAICHLPETKKSLGKLPYELTVDHDHQTGRIRGLLCSKCNTGLGQFKDDVGVLSAAIEYLTKEE